MRVRCVWKRRWPWRRLRGDRRRVHPPGLRERGLGAVNGTSDAKAHRPKRVIACLDVRGGRVVKGVRFEDVQEVGDPAELAAEYDRQGADEIVVLDIDATVEGRSATLDVVRRVARVVTVPLTVGGGLRSLADMQQVIEAGADKLSIGSSAVARPELVAEAAATFGAERIVAAIDCRRAGSERGVASGWEVVIHGGRTPTGLDAVAWAQRLAELGAGELVLNSIDADGTKAGYDNELNRRVAAAVDVPVVASGGAGTLEHLRDGFLLGGVDAVLVASMLHFKATTVQEIKRYLRDAGVPVSLPPAEA